jgi:hypothetical protein
MKSNIVAQTLSRLAKSIGLVAEDSSSSADDIYTRARRPEDVKKALAAARRLRAQARAMKLGVTRDEILAWVKQGRR